MSEETLAEKAFRLRIPQSEIARALDVDAASISRAMSDELADRIAAYLDQEEKKYRGDAEETTQGDDAP